MFRDFYLLMDFRIASPPRPMLSWYGQHHDINELVGGSQAWRQRAC
jgi:hypothetical protein